MPVEVFQGIAWRLSESARAPAQLRSNESQPDVSDHSHSWAQARGGTARMIFKEILDIFLYYRRKFFDFKRGHIQGNDCAPHFGLGDSKSIRRVTRRKRREIGQLYYFREISRVPTTLQPKS
jgi:hypothetical protein